MINVEKVETSGIFKSYVAKTIPLAFDESLSYYECLCALLNYLKNTILPAIDNNADAVIELQGLYVELKDYVDNYFENLDIQTEINNKLDEMAESGELADIIAQYLQVASVLGFDTKATLKSAENLAEGSIARTLGTDTYNDGKGNYYKIRTVTTGDVIDDDNILALSEYPTLIAEKMPDYRMNQAESAINTINNTTIPAINTRIDNIVNKKYIMIGDSYGQGFNPDGNVTGWPRVLKGLLGLTDDNCTIACQGGAGFANTSYLYSTILTNLPADDDVTDIIFGGGYNDLSWGNEAIAQGFSDCNTLIQTKFPNAKVHVAYFPICINVNTAQIYYKYQTYVSNSNLYNWNFLANVRYCLMQGTFLASDNVHINQNGENAVANAIYMALNGGYNYSKFNDNTLTKNSIFNAGTFNMHLYSVNDISILANYTGTQTFTVSSASNRLNLYDDGTVTLGSLTRNGMIGRGYYANQWQSIGSVVVHDTSLGWFTLPAKVTIDDYNNLLLHVDRITSDAHNGYAQLTSVDSIQVPIFSVTMPTMTL